MPEKKECQKHCCKKARGENEVCCTRGHLLAKRIPDYLEIQCDRCKDKEKVLIPILIEAGKS